MRPSLTSLPEPGFKYTGAYYHIRTWILQILREKHDSPERCEEELHAWFDPLHLVVTGNTLEVFFPHTFFVHWFQKKGQSLFEKSIQHVLGPNIHIEYHLNASPSASPLPVAPSSSFLPSSPEKESVPASDFVPGPEDLNTFLCNPKNQFTLDTLKKSIEEAPLYNPILLRGTSGTGKTHLLKAMANVAETKAKGCAFYLDASQISSSSLAPWKIQYGPFFQQCTLFCLDNVHLLIRLPAIQEELVAILDHYVQRKILFIASAPLETGPGQDPIKQLIPTLASRLCMGIVLELSPPDMDVRMQYAKLLLDQHNLSSHRHLPLLLARRCSTFRQLQGVTTRLAAFWAFSGQLPDEHDLDMIFRSNGVSDTLTPELILALVATSYGFTLKDLRSKKREPKLVRTRQIAMYLCRELLGESYPALGRIFGNKDHSTVIHAVKKITKMRLENKDMHNELTGLTQRCEKYVSQF